MTTTPSLRYVTFVFLLLLTAFTSKSQTIPFAPHTKGIEFEHSKWSLVLEKAKKEQKFIFIDCYTSWCGPCKWMAANVFTDDTVGQFYNTNFINFKQDMEKGEGVELSRQFQITAYPTFIYFDSTGKPVKREMGGMPGNLFINQAAEAMHLPFQADSLEKRFAKGQRDERFLINYMLFLLTHQMPYEKVMKAYFSAIKDEALLLPIHFNRILLFTNDIFSREFQFVLKNETACKAQYGGTVVNDFIRKVANANLKSGTAAKDTKRVKRALELLDQHK